MSLAELVPAASRGPGLSAAELAAAQDAAQAPFPPDLCDLLVETLPTGRQFPDWRNRPREAMDAWRERVVDEVHFDVRENRFWPADWGERPDDAAESLAVVAERLAAAPALIPIYAHRAIPNEPLTAGNPVLSVMQTDIIVYGADLEEYLRNEFGERPGRTVARPIRFWTETFGL